MVVVFGSINLDLVAQVDRIPVAGETLAGRTFGTAPGGKGANQALAAKRAGAQVRMFGAVGRDAFAADVLANLEAGGVDLSGVIATELPTGVALIHVDARGENAITVIAGANGNVSAEQVPDALLEPETTLVLQLEVLRFEIERLVRRTRSARVILNAAPAMALPEELLRRVGTLIVNETEAAAIGVAIGLPTTPNAFAQAASARFGNAVVVTLGARGALAVCDKQAISITAPATTVVDTTGAGDALVGAFAAALDRGTSLREALAEGVAAGTLACGHFGAQAGMPAQDAIRVLAATL
ncbi:MAG: ribokinase [Betaproteobacteria bacterium]